MRIEEIIDSGDFKEHVDRIWNSLPSMQPRAKDVLKWALACVYFFDFKNRHYGEKNLDEFGEFGNLVRISDKRQRLKNMILFLEETPDETIIDNWADIAVYALGCLAFRIGDWPDEFRLNKQNK